MTGYDQKMLTLTTDQDTSVTIEVDIDHQTGWHPYKTLALKANQPQTYKFPTGFSAHWVRQITTTACTATAEFEYE